MKVIFKHIIYISVIIILFNIFYTKNIYAESETEEYNEKITLTSTIKNITNSANNVYTYKIEPAESNIKDGLTETKYFKVNFENIEADSSNSVTAHYDIDFSNIEFKQYGLYEYIITEVESSNPEVYPISNAQYKIYVQVVNEDDKTIKKVAMQATNLQNDEKTKLVYTHVPNNTYIKIAHRVRGNAITPNEYLLYKISINGNIGDKYNITGQDDTVVFNGKKITTNKIYTVKPGEENYCYIYLKEDQTITIGLVGQDLYQIPVGVEYKISSLESRKWKTIIDNVETKSINHKPTLKSGENNLVEIIQEKNFDVALTGIFINILPYLILIIAGTIGILFSIKIKKKESKKDENI